MANKQGKDFLNAVRSIVQESSRQESSARAAHITAFSILVLIDGSGESFSDVMYELKTKAGQDVKFLHHELGAAED